MRQCASLAAFRLMMCLNMPAKGHPSISGTLSLLPPDTRHMWAFPEKRIDSSQRRYSYLRSRHHRTSWIGTLGKLRGSQLAVSEDHLCETFRASRNYNYLDIPQWLDAALCTNAFR